MAKISSLSGEIWIPAFAGMTKNAKFVRFSTACSHVQFQELGRDISSTGPAGVSVSDVARAQSGRRGVCNDG
jgi:hypothetical protein